MSASCDLERNSDQCALFRSGPWPPLHAPKCSWVHGAAKLDGRVSTFGWPRNRPANFVFSPDFTFAADSGTDHLTRYVAAVSEDFRDSASLGVSPSTLQLDAPADENSFECVPGFQPFRRAHRGACNAKDEHLLRAAPDCARIDNSERNAYREKIQETAPEYVAVVKHYVSPLQSCNMSRSKCETSNLTTPYL